MEPIIKIDHVSKSFAGSKSQVHALNDVSLDIHRGDIFGIIGMSGAGKSTLVRCLNFLEKPTEGHVYVEGKDLGSLTGKELRQMRTKISMIFQHSNLLMQKNIIDNVWFYGSCYDEEENARLIFNADLCVSPGNVGLTAIHSLTFGTPVLTHDDFIWQMPEYEVIKDGKTGCFFEKDNAENLAKKIMGWFDIISYSREEVRKSCFEVIDKEWNPYYQMKVFQEIIGDD